MECDKCEERFSLWDDLEKLFASDDVCRQVEGLQAVDAHPPGLPEKRQATRFGSRFTNHKCRSEVFRDSRH